jgi:hypothetical protein
MTAFLLLPVINIKSSNLIQHPKTSLILIGSCSMRQRFLEALFSEQGEIDRTGAPRNG